MEEISVRSKWAKIRSLEKRFFATHLINIGVFVGVDPDSYAIEEARNIISKMGLEKLVSVWLLLSTKSNLMFV